jgi:hypothetical protein
MFYRRLPRSLRSDEVTSGRRYAGARFATLARDGGLQWEHKP